MSLLFFAFLAWQVPIDEATLAVHSDTAVIARETFRLTGVRTGAGWTLATTVRWEHPIRVLAPSSTSRETRSRRASSSTSRTRAIPSASAVP